MSDWSVLQVACVGSFRNKTENALKAVTINLNPALRYAVMQHSCLTTPSPPPHHPLTTSSPPCTQYALHSIRLALNTPYTRYTLHSIRLTLNTPNDKCRLVIPARCGHANDVVIKLTRQGVVDPTA
eukprot:6692199-Pyramimonas_sp.AAC.1